VLFRSRIPEVFTARLLLPIAFVPLLSACGSLLSATTADVAGVASAGIASGITKNAAVGTGIGLGVAAGAHAGLRYVERRVHGAEQDQIAAAAGQLAAGQVASWSVVHSVPLEPSEHGQVAVFRSIDEGRFKCKEIVFSVLNDKQDPEGFYTTAICFDGQHWRWAQAEPSISRWVEQQ
jgi:hypothetical protein